MDEVIELLKRKTTCLQSFYHLCQKFLLEIEAGSIKNLNTFRKQRHGLIHLMKNLDIKIKPLIVEKNLDSNQLAPHINTKDILIKNINELDEKILNHIINHRSVIIQKLQSLQFGKKTILAYRSPQHAAPNASRLKILDTEV